MGKKRSYDTWFKKANLTNNGETSTIAWPWMRGFVDLVGGDEIASYLLRDAGKFPSGYNITEKDEDWKIQYTFRSTILAKS